MKDYVTVQTIFAYCSFVIAILALLLGLIHQNLKECMELCNQRKNLARRFTVLLLLTVFPIALIVFYPIIGTFLLTDPQKGLNLFIKLLFLYSCATSLIFFALLYEWNRFQRALLKTIWGDDIDKIVDEISY